VIKFTHRGLGRDKLPATAPVLPLFGGRRYVLVSYVWLTKKQKTEQKDQAPTSQTEKPKKNSYR
jgi:hypothetical protein